MQRAVSRRRHVAPTRGRRHAVGALVAAVVLAAGCSSGSSTSSGSASPGLSERAPGSGVARGGWDCPGGSCSWERSGESSAAPGASEAEAFEQHTVGAPVPGVAKGAPTTRPVDSPTVGVEPPARAERTLPVTAGSIDDNEAWDQYLRYRQAFDGLGLEVDRIPVESRQVITVVDAVGRPVLGADVQIQDANNVPVAQLRTYADGRALFHPLGFPDGSPSQRPGYRAAVTKGSARAQIELSAGQRAYTATLDQEVPRAPVQLDVLFLVDATGSMGDEIDRLKANIDSVSTQLAALPAQPDVHFAMTVYRDRGDLFVTRNFDFTSDRRQFAEALDAVEAGGGGDTPEDLNAALATAVTKPAWRGPDAVKLVFLIADAPPHLDYPDSSPYAASLAQASAMGIKIMPIAASGLDDRGEYIFRQFAQLTLGRFVFLTYGADGRSPGASTPHQVDPDEYSVLALDELVVKLATEEVARVA